MTQYIDKSAVVAKIKRRIVTITTIMTKFYYAKNYKGWEAMVIAYKDILSFLDTLEVKEVMLNTNL